MVRNCKRASEIWFKRLVYRYSHANSYKVTISLFLQDLRFQEFMHVKVELDRVES